MDSQSNTTNNSKQNYLLWFVSIFIPVVAIGLMYSPLKTSFVKGVDLNFLPGINAVINATVMFFLLMGLIFIKQRKIEYHKRAMLSATLGSTLFLIIYIFYHVNQEEPTRYGGDGALKYIYYFLLLTHIVLAAVMTPMVIFTLHRALTGNFEKHKKLARWTWPVYMYVSATGVLVYLLISPYYT